MTASGSTTTSASIHVLAGSTIVTPASMCASLTRSRSAAAAAASSTRVFTPSVSTGLPPLCTATRSPSITRMPTESGQVELALRVVRREPVEHRPQPICPEHVDERVDLAHCSLVLRRVAMLDDRARLPSSRRSTRPYARGSSGSNDRTVAATSSRRWTPTSSRSRSDVSSGVSPESTRTSSVRPSRASRAQRTASPVPAAPPGWRPGCRRTPKPSRERPPRRARGRRPPPRRPAPSRPCAARGSRAGAWERPSACACRDWPPSRRPPAFSRRSTTLRLGRQDSNLGSRDQNPLPYPLGHAPERRSSCQRRQIVSHRTGHERPTSSGERRRGAGPHPVHSRRGRTRSAPAPERSPKRPRLLELVSQRRRGEVVSRERGEIPRRLDAPDHAQHLVRTLLEPLRAVSLVETS